MDSILLEKTYDTVPLNCATKSRIITTALYPTDFCDIVGYNKLGNTLYRQWKLWEKREQSPNSMRGTLASLRDYLTEEYGIENIVILSSPKYTTIVIR